MKIAIDFDGTIVEDAYPEIGKPMLFAFETMKALQKERHQLILWTYRSGQELEDAVQFCLKNGIEFYAVNNSYPEEKFDGETSRKIHAHIFIDDRNIGGFPGWSKIWQMLGAGSQGDYYAVLQQSAKKRDGFWRRIFGRVNLLLTLTILAFWVTACPDSPERGGSPVKDEPVVVSTRAEKPAGRIDEPVDGELFTIGDDVGIVFSHDGPESAVSAGLLVDGADAVLSGDIAGRLVWNTSGQPAGTRKLRLNVHFEDGRIEYYTFTVRLKSDIVPSQYTFRIVNSYPHDIRAFTQGLVYHEGFLYESTGQYGQSTLRKVDLESGQVLRSHSLDRDQFGEGLCVHDGRLYQLTWKSKIGFVYDIETFRILRRVYYQTEGWGLTSNGSSLIKSDGSHYLYLMDPLYFSETGRMEVFDNNGVVANLNELEFIDGIIYANVFGSDNIVMIESETGRLTGIIDLTGLLDRRHRHPNLDVLNGIAYDHENERLFVTGKNWPVLFEIEVVPK
jgi:glutaminyl-peptide cyclotransferase